MVKILDGSITIDGSVGCGKSTLIQSINEETRLPIFLEPVGLWKNWLELFYSDCERWGLAFNTNVLVTYSDWKNNSFPAIYERSPFSCRNVFVEAQKDAGSMNDLEIKLFDKLYENMAWSPSTIIYLRTDPKICYERMSTRNRECEQNVSLEYLEILHEKYEHMMNHLYKGKLHIVDGNQEESKVKQDVLNILFRNNSFPPKTCY